MDNSEFTSANKIQQQKNWDSVAAGWQKWWKIFEKGRQKVSDKLVELAGIKIGQRVLDIATGIGEPALTACRKIGDSGYLLATDISPEMLAIGRERARYEGLNNIDFKEGDAATLVLPSSTFDAALCRWGLMFLPNPKAGLSNIYKSLVKGGHFAAAVWASPEKVPFISVPMNIVLQETNSPPPRTLGPFSMSDQNNLKKLFEESGFIHIVIERIKVVSDFESSDDFAAFTIDHGGPALQKVLAGETNERRQQIENAISKGSEKYADSTGKVSFENEAIVIVGRK